MNKIKVKDLNLNKIEIERSLDDEIPDYLDLSNLNISAFNKRSFNPDNFNKIIGLANFLKMKSLENFIVKGLTPTSELYVLTEENKKIIKLPKFLTHNTYQRPDYCYPSLTINVSRYNVLCQNAVRFGLKNWLRFGAENNYGWLSGFQNGDRNNKRNPFGESDKTNLFNIAIQNKRINMLKYVLKLYMKLIPHRNIKNISWDEYSSCLAVEKGTLEILKFLDEYKCKITVNTFKACLEFDKVDCLKYLLDNHNFKADEFYIYLAVSSDSLECLKFFDDNKYKLPYNLVETCCSHNSIKCLKYIISRNWFIEKDVAADILFRNNYFFNEQYFDPLKKKIIANCIENKSLDCLKYLVEDEKFEINDKVVSSINFTSYKQRECMEYLANKKLITRPLFGFP